MNPRVLLFEDRKHHDVLYALNLHLYVGAKVIHRHSIAETFEYLSQKAEGVDLIIARKGEDESDYPKQLSQYLKKLGVSIPIVGIQEEAREGNFDKESRREQLSHLLRTVAHSLEITADVMADRDMPEFYPIPLVYFEDEIEVGCQVYQKTMDGEFLGLMKKGDFLKSMDFKQLSDLDESCLYVRSTDRLEFCKRLSAFLIDRLQSSETEEAPKAQLSEMAQKVITEQARSLGVTEESIVLAQVSIDYMLNTTKKIPTLQSLMDTLFSDDLSFRYRHSHLTAFIAIHLLQQTDWSNKDTQQKIGMCAFFHNLALTKDEMAAFKTDEEVDESELSDQDKKTVYEHAKRAASLLSRFDQIPLDVVKIVRQHHGSLSGIGLSEGPNKVLPLTALFMLAAEWAHLAIEFESRHISLSQPKLLRHLHEKFDYPPFKKVLPLLQKLKI